jgi:hypothetical protein
MPDAEYDQRPNIEMEPTRLTVRVIMSPRRAAHFGRWADGEGRGVRGGAYDLC